MNHPVEAYGFRVEADGAVLAYTGDTDTCDALTPLLTGADLALADSAFVDGRDDTPGHPPVGLSRGRRRGRRRRWGPAARAHPHPAWNDPEVCRAQAAAVWSGPLDLAVQGKTYEVGGRRRADRPRNLSRARRGRP